MLTAAHEALADERRARLLASVVTVGMCASAWFAYEAGHHGDRSEKVRAIENSGEAVAMPAMRASCFLATARTSSGSLAASILASG